MKTLNKKIVNFVFIFSFLLGLTSSVNAQFLIENETTQPKIEKVEKKEIPKQVEKEEIKERTKVNIEKETLPPFIATNIRVTKIEEPIDSVKITWNSNFNSGYSFMVGRANSKIDSERKALKAISVKSSNENKNEVIDENLAPGTYYYVVLAKEKIIEKDLDLYADVNYTVIPVEITMKKNEDLEKIDPKIDATKESVSVKSILPRITKLEPKVLENGYVDLQWQGENLENIRFNIYRNRMPIPDVQTLLSSRLIAQTKSQVLQFYDTGIKKSGNYYYAVLPVKPDGSLYENLQENKNYLVKPVYVSALAERHIYDIKLIKEYGNDVKIIWSHPHNVTGEYLLYRSKHVIDSLENLSFANLVARIPVNQNYYIDREKVSGKYYYAVLVKQLDGNLAAIFEKDENYSSTSVLKDEFYTLTTVNVEKVNSSDAMIRWTFKGTYGQKMMKLIRLKEEPKSWDDLKKGFLVDTINLADCWYIDRRPPVGNYYYAIVPYFADGLEHNEFKLTKGINFSAKKIAIRHEQEILEFQPGFEPPVFVDKERPIIVTPPQKKKNVTRAEDVYKKNDKSFSLVDPRVKKEESVNLKNISKIPEKKLEDKFTHEDLLKKQEKVKKPVLEKKIKKYKPLASKPVQPKIQPKRESYSDLSLILKKYYYKNNYTKTISRLQNYLKGNISNYERAKAKFFIGRSYIELKNYNEALNYFFDPDVMNTYPKEAKFWSEYAISKGRR